MSFLFITPTKIAPKKRALFFVTTYQFFEQWVVQIENFLKMESLLSTEDGTRDHFVSIDFHEFENGGITTVTMKIFCMKETKKYGIFWHLSFIFHPKSVYCGSIETL